MAASKGSRIASLILRILTFVLIFISLLIIATNSKTVLKGTEAEAKVEFKDVYSYRYLTAAAVIGAALSLLQIALTLYHVVTKSDGTPFFDMFSDKLLTYLLLSGASAGLGAGIDLRSNYKDLVGNIFNSFFDKGSASAAILLLAFICSAVVSILSSLALVRKP
ncbi:CASP-like protein 4D1 [Momordica charantia]|uniref:CASP-like protein n=1 Tax=Momordica charantia TaxID=3673 RepID=A0A6J1C1A4_MOMCH|nr:CASP-like protein 4D1 [Momordica charantia]